VVPVFLSPERTICYGLAAGIARIAGIAGVATATVVCCYKTVIVAATAEQK